MSIAENLAQVRERIAISARRAGRNPGDITLMAVSKTVEPARIREAYDAGHRLFGENRVQEFAKKHSALRNLPGAEWHMIGHLQSNKASKAAELFGAIDSVDSARLAERLNAAAQSAGKKLQFLIEVNTGGEEAKSGVEPVFKFVALAKSGPLVGASSELGMLVFTAKRYPALEIRGLMTVPPFPQDPEGARPYFRKLRELRDQIAAQNIPGVSLDVLSMGMSHDFEVAIEEGSTCVRIGTAIFGARQKH